MDRPSCSSESTRDELLERIRGLEAERADSSGQRGRDQYRDLFERSADAILIIEGETFTECNQATVDMLRYRTRRELLQTHPSDLSPEFQPDGRRSFEKASEMMTIAREKGSHRFEWDHRRADGSVFPVEVLLTAVESGERALLHVVWRDITERKRLESELRQAQKMEAMGRLTGGIAHDFNNVLVAILGYAELVEVGLPADSDLHEYVEQIRIAGGRAASLVGQLLAFSRKQILEPRVIELNRVVAGAEGLLKPLLGEHISFELNLHGQPLSIKADPVQLEQAIINLATNARDAMPERGTLVIETNLVHLDEHSIGETLRLQYGSYAVLSVADTGEGIPPADLPRIFDPFFTSKNMGDGTGLGLSTVHGIVKQSGGDVAVLSEMGRGTIFKIYLPVTEEPLETEQPDRDRYESRERKATETILLVEDEAAVSGLVETILRRAGYQVVVAADGLEALTLVDALDLRPDLLLTDVVMPNMGGPELAQQLLQTQPDLKVLYASGYTNSALISRGALEEGVELIRKPFTPGELLSRLRLVFLTAD